MSRSKRKNKGSVSELRLDLVFSALGDQTRRTLLAQLARGPAMITELAEPFGISLPAVSRHIRVLERAQLVERSVEGRVHRCSLRAEPLEKAEKWLAQYREFWIETLDALARHVQTPDSKRVR